MKTTITAAILLILFSCSKNSTVLPAPVADFAYSGQGVAPSTVIFANSSAAADSYFWDFGDDSTSTEQSPKHIFQKEGTYRVSLTATSSRGTSTKTANVTITAPLAAILSSLSITAAAPSTSIYFQITDSAGNIFTTGGTVSNYALPLTWAFTPAFVANLTATYQIRVFENNVLYDGMAFRFKDLAMYTYPKVATLNVTGHLLTVKLGMTWQ